MVTPLLELLKGDGEVTSSIEALAATVGCVPDEDEMMATSNVDRLMRSLVHTMMSCSDYKIEDMGHRHELKFVVSKKYSGCSHRPRDEIIKQKHYAVTLRLSQFEGGEVSPVQNALVNSLKTECKHTCDQCKEVIVTSVSRHINVNCDPDFLTIFFDDPRDLQESDLMLQFSESTYAVKVVTHWNKERQKSAVSVKRSDGWWWYGTDMDQATRHRYNAKETYNALSKAIVLMCVRVIHFDSCEENDEDIEELKDFANSQGRTNNGGKQQLSGDSMDTGEVEATLLQSTA